MLSYLFQHHYILYIIIILRNHSHAKPVSAWVVGTNQLHCLTSRPSTVNSTASEQKKTMILIAWKDDEKGRSVC